MLQEPGAALRRSNYPRAHTSGAKGMSNLAQTGHVGLCQVIWLPVSKSCQLPPTQDIFSRVSPTSRHLYSEFTILFHLAYLL